MGKAAYEENMKRQIQDFGFAIDRARRRLTQAVDYRAKVDLMARLSGLEKRRHELEEKLTELRSQPESAWTNLKAYFEEEWTDLVQDFEERVAELR